MKKFARILSLVLVAVMLCATLASCGGPAKDPDDAVAALKDNGYTAVKTGNTVVGEKDGETITITYYDDEDAATKAYDEAKQQMEKVEEEIAKLEDELKEQQDKYDDMEDGVLKDAAKIALDAAKEAVELAKKAKDYKIGKSGTMVWLGTSQAIKDAK